jgi:hypothetical protein
MNISAKDKVIDQQFMAALENGAKIWQQILE